MTDCELMHQALKALEVMRPACFAETTLKAADTAINALRNRLAQPEQTLTCVCGAVWEGELMVHAPRDRLAQPKQELVFDCPRCGHCCSQPNQEPVAWSEREIKLIDGMIEVQLNHARTCDSMANRTMADKQKGWDLERVALLQKIRATPPAAAPKQEPVAYTTGHCKQRAQPGGCQLHNVHCGYPDCDRKAVTTPPPPQRQWVGLTPEEVKEISFANRPYVVDMVVALEARLKEKNCG